MVKKQDKLEDKHDGHDSRNRSTRREDLLTGCQAVVAGVRLADVDVISAYPIRPYTEVMDILSQHDRRRRD